MSDTTQPLYPPGTVVQLRSGGPNLTVTRSVGTSTHVIYYNSETGLYEQFHTNEACLREANQAPQLPPGVRYGHQR